MIPQFVFAALGAFGRRHRTQPLCSWAFAAKQVDTYKDFHASTLLDNATRKVINNIENHNFVGSVDIRILLRL